MGAQKPFTVLNNSICFEYESLKFVSSNFVTIWILFQNISILNKLVSTSYVLSAPIVLRVSKELIILTDSWFYFNVYQKEANAIYWGTIIQVNFFLFTTRNRPHPVQSRGLMTVSSGSLEQKTKIFNVSDSLSKTYSA